MSTLYQKFSYTVFYVNKDGRYETMYVKSIWDIPEHLKIGSTYVYTPNTFNYGDKPTNWIYFRFRKAVAKGLTWSWLYDLDALPQEVKALALLSGIYQT